jgi:hypothetical protein
MANKETLEEATNKYITNIGYKSDKEYYKFEKLIQFGAKWQAERMYSDDEVIAFVKWMYDYKATINKVEELFEQFKK